MILIKYIHSSPNKPIEIDLESFSLQLLPKQLTIKNLLTRPLKLTPEASKPTICVINQTCIDFICVFGSTNPALLSSNEYSTLSSGISSALKAGGGRATAGVVVVCIATDRVEGVDGTGIDIAFGVMFWSSSVATEIFFKGVNGTLLVGLVFCNGSLDAVFASLIEFVVFVFGWTVVAIGAKGFRIPNSGCSRALASELLWLGG